MKDESVLPIIHIHTHTHIHTYILYVYHILFMHGSQKIQQMIKIVTKILKKNK